MELCYRGKLLTLSVSPFLHVSDSIIIATSSSLGCVTIEVVNICGLELCLTHCDVRVAYYYHLIPNTRPSVERRCPIGSCYQQMGYQKYILRILTCPKEVSAGFVESITRQRENILEKLTNRTW